MLIDDTRDLECSVIARNYWEGIKQLEANGPWDELLLDHDLASYDKHGRERTGYDIMLFLEQFPQHLPGKITLVTANPVGRDRMQTVIERLYARS